MSKIQIDKSLEDYIKEETINVMDELKINRNFKGYSFLITTTIIIYKANIANEYISAKEIYAKTASKHRTSRSKVERDIRYIHESYLKELQKYFDFSMKVTTKQLMFTLAHVVEKRIESKTVYQGTAEIVKS